MGEQWKLDEEARIERFRRRRRRKKMVKKGLVQKNLKPQSKPCRKMRFQIWYSSRRSEFYENVFAK